jgi:hypothetical protein
VTESTGSLRERELDILELQELQKYCVTAADSRCCLACDATWLRRSDTIKRVVAALAAPAESQSPRCDVHTELCKPETDLKIRLECVRELGHKEPHAYEFPTWPSNLPRNLDSATRPAPKDSPMQLLINALHDPRWQEESTEAARDIAGRARKDVERYLQNPQPPAPVQQEEEREGLCERITNYLANGGLFNPESMEHDKVRTLLLDCRAALAHPTPGDRPAIPPSSKETI